LITFQKKVGRPLNKVLSYVLIFMIRRFPLQFVMGVLSYFYFYITSSSMIKNYNRIWINLRKIRQTLHDYKLDLKHNKSWWYILGLGGYAWRKWYCQQVIFPCFVIWHVDMIGVLMDNNDMLWVHFFSRICFITINKG